MSLRARLELQQLGFAGFRLSSLLFDPPEFRVEGSGFIKGWVLGERFEAKVQ